MSFLIAPNNPPRRIDAFLSHTLPWGLTLGTFTRNCQMAFYEGSQRCPGVTATGTALLPLDGILRTFAWVWPAAESNCQG